MAERVYCLYRVSTTRQVDRDEKNQADIPMQRKSCHDFTERMEWNIIHEEQENGVSGFKVHAADRDKIQLIKEHTRQGKFDILLVFMFDRIGRIAAETPFVVEELVQSGVRVWSVNEGESGSTPTPTSSQTTSDSGRPTARAKRPLSVPRPHLVRWCRRAASVAALPPSAIGWKRAVC